MSSQVSLYNNLIMPYYVTWWNSMFVLTYATLFTECKIVFMLGLQFQCKWKASLKLRKNSLTLFF